MFKRLLILTLLTALLLGLVPALAASPVEDLTMLAQYFPFDAPAYAALNTGDETITELDNVLAAVLAKVPASIPLPEGLSLRAALDTIAHDADTEDFETGIRSWLGDYAAVGVTMKDDPTTAASEGTLLAAQITDRAAAVAFWRAILDRGGSPTYAVEEGDAFTMLAIQSDPPIEGGLLFTDEVMLLGVENLRALLLTRDAKLAQNDTFQQTLALLPAELYGGLVYLNLPVLADESADSQMAAAVLGQQALGFALLDERSLVLDVASKLGDTSALAAQGFTLPALAPVNPAFAANLPAAASLVAHASNLRGFYDAFIEFDRFQVSQWTDGSKPEDVDRKWEQLAFAVRGFTGLDLEDDILSWMTGDFALFASIDSAAIRDFLLSGMAGEQPRLETLPLSFGLVVEATDAAKAQATAAGLAKALTQLTAEQDTITLSTETLGGADVTVLSAPIELQPNYKVPFEVVIGANDAVFVVATRDAATAILEGQPGLSGTAAFADAARYILPDATSIWYMDNNGFSAFAGIAVLGILGPAIGNVFDSIVADLETGTVSTLTPEQIQQQQDEYARQQQAQLQQTQDVLSLLNTVLNSGTISTTSVDGSTLSRFVLTLAP